MIGEGLQHLPWAVVWEESVVVGALVNSSRFTFQLPETNYGVSFGVRLTAFAGGSITPKFRLGFSTVDAATSVRGLDLRALAAVDASDWGGIPAGIAAVAPDVDGSASTICPPYVNFLFDSAIGTNLTYIVIASCWYAP